jgi:hypothetical protein
MVSWGSCGGLACEGGYFHTLLELLIILFAERALDPARLFHGLDRSGGRKRWLSTSNGFKCSTMISGRDEWPF